MKNPTLASLLFLAVSGAQALTYLDLIRRLTDLEALAVLPEAGEKGAQSSSRDRASAYDGASGTFTHWGANDDCCGSLRTDADGGKVLAEMEGPGVIGRINGSSPSQGRVKIFLDGAAQPAVDLAWDEYFDHTQAPFIHSTLAYRSAGGYNNYYPIPYQKSCKVVAYEGWWSYYQIGYTTFPKGTVVPTFKRNLTAEEKQALADADQFFAQGLGRDPAGPRMGQSNDSSSHRIGAGQTTVLLDAAGPGALTGIRIRVQGLSTRAQRWAALRELALSIHWDGEARPAVWAPLGDFFGSACGLNAQKSLPFGVADDGWMYAYWYMPFATGAKVALANGGSATRNVDVSLTRAPLSRSLPSLGRFHAKWNRNAFPPGRADRWPDQTVLKTSGRGRFLGFGLHLFKPDDAVDPASGPGHYWWGEGDEKFWVDGEKFPSWYGTGTEDYFGYAWATPDLFSKPYHGQVFNEGGIHWKGNRSMYRVQITDNVPFQSGFEGALEKYYGDAFSRYGVLPFWYLAPGGEDPYGEASLEERTGYYQAPAAGDTTRLEGEALVVLSRTAGSLVPQAMEWAGAGRWSGDQHLFWYRNNLGEVDAGAMATLALPVARPGDYRVVANFTRAFDYGQVRLSLDGTACGDILDLYQPGPTLSGEMSLCMRNLTAGDHALGLTITGKHADSKAFYVGLDYLKLVPLPTAVLPQASPPAAGPGTSPAEERDLLGRKAQKTPGTRLPLKVIKHIKQIP